MCCVASSEKKKELLSGAYYSIPLTNRYHVLLRRADSSRPTQLALSTMSETGGRPVSMPPLDAQLAVKVLEDAMEKFELLEAIMEAMQSLQDHSSTDELSQRIGVLCWSVRL